MNIENFKDRVLTLSLAMSLKAFLLGLFLISCATGGSQMKLGELVPKEISGWQMSKPDEYYDRKTIFDYIDGEGEVYLRYSFRKVFVREYKAESQPAITLQIFDMGRDEDAFGIFSFEREDESVGIGQDSEYSPRLLRFWKGRYFVCVSADKETPESIEAILALGKSTAEAIKTPGNRPQILNYLPEDGLLRNSIRYFHEPFCLSYHFPISEENILNLNTHTDALLASYRLENAVLRLIIAQYPEEKDATTAFAKFANAFTSPSAKEEFVKRKAGKWMGGRRVRRCVVAVFVAPSEAKVKELLEKTSKKLEEFYGKEMEQ